MITAHITIAEEEASQMIEQGQPTHKVLAHLVNMAEEMMGEMAVSSILVLDKQGLLRNGASPRLPYDYLTAIDGLKPNANLGTCAAVAATGKMVITSDFLEDKKWAELKHLPLALGFVSAWSIPIKNPGGKVLGTFGTYFREKRQPSQPEIDLVIALAAIAAKALDPL
ncbi:MAG: GAF domain-containing protein [Chitinophagaceae bacterium]